MPATIDHWRKVSRSVASNLVQRGYVMGFNAIDDAAVEAALTDGSDGAVIAAMEASFKRNSLRPLHAMDMRLVDIAAQSCVEGRPLSSFGVH